MLVTDFNSVKLLFELIDILLLGHFHLFQDFLLSMQLAIEVLSLGHRFVNLVLEFDVLLMQYLDLTIGSIELNLSVFNGKDLVLEITSGCKELSICGCVLFLFFFVSLYPHITGFFFTSDDLL